MDLSGIQFGYVLLWEFNIVKDIGKTKHQESQNERVLFCIVGNRDSWN